MNDELYVRFSTVLGAIPEADLLATLARVEHAIDQACRTAEADAVFVPIGMTGQPVDSVLRVLTGRRVRELGEVWTRLRGELADALVKRGAEPDVVRELRDGGPRPDDGRHPRPLMAPATDVVAEPDTDQPHP